MRKNCRGAWVGFRISRSRFPSSVFSRAASRRSRWRWRRAVPFRPPSAGSSAGCLPFSWPRAWGRSHRLIRPRGALYHWSSILGGRGWGWATAWINLLGLIFVVASVDVGVWQLFRDLVVAGVFHIDVTSWTALSTDRYRRHDNRPSQRQQQSRLLCPGGSRRAHRGGAGARQSLSESNLPRC